MRFQKITWLRLFLALALLVHAISPVSYGQVAGAASLLAALQTLNEIKTAINSALTSGDNIAANRLQDIQTRTDTLIKQIKDVQSGIVKDTNSVETQVFMDLHSIMREAHAAVVSTQRRAYLDVNNTLVNVSRNLDAIPFVKVDPYIFAVDPMRVTPETSDLAVFIYGFFPDVNDSLMCCH